MTQTDAIRFARYRLAEPRQLDMLQVAS